MTNQLYPAFFRLDRLRLLVVGAGAVGEEKLRFILKSSPNARVIIVAPWMGDKLKTLLDDYHSDFLATKPFPFAGGPGDLYSSSGMPGVAWADKTAAGLWRTVDHGEVMWLKRDFQAEDVAMADLIVAATDIKEVNHAVHAAAKAARRLCNIADTPELCDFYLGSIVTRGPLKVAVSTNGQSPTFAKRFRQFLEAELPSFETTNLLADLKAFRDRLTGDFAAKVRQLNAVTSNLLAAADQAERGCACPPGECLVAAAGKAPRATAGIAPTTSPAPAAPANNPTEKTI